jgi:hypothetical protein
MPTYTFSSADPCAVSLEIGRSDDARADIGRRIETIMGSRAYWDSTDPHHHRAKSEVGAGFELLFGTQPIDGGGKRLGITFGPDGVVTPPLEMTVATGQQGDDFGHQVRGSVPQA